jgi:type IV secretory pathway VirB2 component (pilin)
VRINWETIFLVFGVMMFLAINPVFASTSTGGVGLPVEGWLQTIMRSFTGTVAFTIMIMAVLAAGITYAFGGGHVSEFVRIAIYLVAAGGFTVGAVQFGNTVFTGAVITESCEWAWRVMDVCHE